MHVVANGMLKGVPALRHTADSRNCVRRAAGLGWCWGTVIVSVTALAVQFTAHLQHMLHARKQTRAGHTHVLYAARHCTAWCQQACRHAGRHLRTTRNTNAPLVPQHDGVVRQQPLLQVLGVFLQMKRASPTCGAWHATVMLTERQASTRKTPMLHGM